MTNAVARVAPEKTAFRPVLPLHLIAGLQPEKMMAKYADKLKDPRWQRVRLQKLESADWGCENCGDKTKTLHVHHKIYRKKHEPWEYELRDLEVLCEGCHEAHHHDEVVMNEILSQANYVEALGLIAGFYYHHEEMDPGRIEEARQSDPLTFAMGYTAQLLQYLDIDGIYKVAEFAVSLTGPNSEARPKFQRDGHLFGKEDA